MACSIQAIIFDMDGVLIDSEHKWPLAANRFLMEHIPDWNDEKTKALIGVSNADAYLLMQKWGACFSKQDFQEFCERIAQEVYQHESELYPGILELLEWLKCRHFPVGLATSSPRSWVDMVLERFRLKAHFQVTMTANDVVQCKPAPEVYLKTAERLQVAPHNCLVLEDSAIGTKAAKAAGMYCVAITNTHTREQLCEADRVIQNLQEFCEILRKKLWAS